MSYTSPLLDRSRDEEIEPTLEGYQLIGDSQFLRLSEQLLDKSRKKKDGVAHLGLCVSGQKANDLFTRVKNGFHPTSNRVVLMIGTNDLLRGTALPLLKRNVELLIIHLIEKKKVRKLIILTIPPVPRLKTERYHWETLNGYNSYLKSLHNGEDICVIDACPYFIKNGDTSRESPLSSSILSSSRGSLRSNSSGILSPMPRCSATSLNFPCTPNNSSFGKVRTNLRIQIEEQKRNIFVIDSDSDEDKESQDSSYSSAHTTPSNKRSSSFSTPNPKRRLHGSYTPSADDDHDDAFGSNDSFSDDDCNKIKEEFFETHFGNDRGRKDEIHLNNAGLRLIYRLICEEI